MITGIRGRIALQGEECISNARKSADCSLHAEHHNFHGFDCFDNYLFAKALPNKTIRKKGFSGVFMDGSDVNRNALTYGENTILVPEADAPMKPSWYRGGWWDSITDFWQELENGFPPLRKPMKSAGPLPHKGIRLAPQGLKKPLRRAAARNFSLCFPGMCPTVLKDGSRSPSGPNHEELLCHPI